MALYLVGTHHLDMKGPERLKKFFNFIRPEVVGLESTIENFNIRIQDHKQFESQRMFSEIMLNNQYGKNIAKNVVSYLSMMGYELWIPNEYTEQNKEVKIVPCDKYDVKIIRPKTQQAWGDKVNQSNEITLNFIEELAKIDFDAYQQGVDSSYNSNSVDELKNDPEYFKQLLLDRDEVAENEIRKIHSTTNNLIYVGGLTHFFGDYNNLYERLKDLSPIRIKLVELDQH